VTVHAAGNIQARFTGAVYVPGEHPVPETVIFAGALLSMRTVTATGVKFATTVFGPFIVTVNGFVVPVAEPVHAEN
jgi:hypothetical protein